MNHLLNPNITELHKMRELSETIHIGYARMITGTGKEERILNLEDVYITITRTMIDNIERTYGNIKTSKGTKVVNCEFTGTIKNIPSIIKRNKE